jgi:hypothetical protein
MEPDLGPGAFSVVRSGKRAFVMATRDSVLMLVVELRASPELAREFAARVKGRLQ